jgi:hypothetical protein
MRLVLLLFVFMAGAAVAEQRKPILHPKELQGWNSVCTAWPPKGEEPQCKLITWDGATRRYYDLPQVQCMFMKQRAGLEEEE